MIGDPVLRWLVSLLFLLSVAECGTELIRGRRIPTLVVSNTLHVVMAVTMIVMAWPLGSHLPNRGLLFFFAFAGVWFLVMILVADRTHTKRAVLGYHAVMMFAMAWMSAAMGGVFLRTQPASHHHTMTTAPEPMPGMDMSRDTPPTDTAPEWIGMVNWLCVIGFTVAALFWTYRYFSTRKHASGGPACGWGAACQAMMAAGIAIMFGSMV